MSPLAIFFAFAQLITFAFTSSSFPVDNTISAATVIEAINSDPSAATAILNAVSSDPEASAAVIAASRRQKVSIPGTTSAPRPSNSGTTRGTTANCPEEKKSKGNKSGSY